MYKAYSGVSASLTLRVTDPVIADTLIVFTTQLAIMGGD